MLAPAIKDIFPHLTVIATSHSPLMVGTLIPGEVVRIRRVDGALSAETIQEDYRGYRVDQILTDKAFELATAREECRIEREALRDELNAERIERHSDHMAIVEALHELAQRLRKSDEPAKQVSP